MDDSLSALQAEAKQPDFTPRQMEVFVRMLEKYLAWVETIQEIAEAGQK
jgi:hypothetical protein